MKYKVTRQNPLQVNDGKNWCAVLVILRSKHSHKGHPNYKPFVNLNIGVA